MLNSKQSWTQHWLLKSILLPFTLTRGLLVLTGYLAPSFLTFSYINDPEVMARGWWFSDQRILDMWFRWDAGWYFTIINEGYKMVENVETMSNLAFFPVYPLLVRLFLLPFPQKMVTNELIMGVALVVSNLLLLGSLVLLYKLTWILFEKEIVANLAVWLLLVFPASFFLSSFYSEASFLFFLY